ncbi:MAG TPA: BatA domain-containing protein, partial [Tepidisphaeraceae bacterium]|nr:BatA domain-containing protein [Tepidisphaeraceae bacterium]
MSNDPYIFVLAAGFVTPGFFIAGALLASVPIIIHILNRRRFKTVNWAAMEFLLKALRRNRRRLRFEQWLLLAVRCLVLFFLGLALARPMGCNDTTLASLAARRAGLHVIVIDNSYSMAYESDRPGAKTNFDQSKILAKEIIDRLSRGGESVAIVTTARPATAVLGAPIYDLQAAKDAVDRIKQSYGGTDLAGALDRARQIAQSESAQPTKTLHLITDSTRSAWEPANATALAGLGHDLARSYKIIHYDVGQPNEWNQAVVDLRSVSHLVRSNFDNDFLADTRGFGNGTDPVLQWKLDQQVLPGAGTVHLTPEQQPAVQSLSQIKQGGLHVISASLATDDRLKSDDVRRRVIDVAAELKVLIVEGERGGGAMSGSGAFLQLALAP